MILKIVLGKGGRGLLNYISQFSKAPIHHPQNDPKIYGRLHIPDPHFNPSRRNKPAAGINQLPNLSFLNVVHNPGPNAPNHRIGQGSGEVFLPGDALHHLVGGPAVDADGLRRRGHRPGATSIEKRGGRRLEKASAPPTFSTFAGTTPREISAEFGALRKMKPNLGKAVAHLILSPGPEDRALSKDEWKRALDLALAEHGASEAPYAAYLHADTHHPHLHCFFSRVTPAGEVISDSNSYQKNRSASLKITQELKLTPLPNTPNPQAPGDRQALQNASRRAERSGTPGPEKINVQAVREALGKATTTDDYVRLNREIGNEIVYLRRGEKQEIYGCKIRRTGSTEWVKMSTLAKDLSWPRIAHRFAESPVMAPAPTVEVPAAPKPATKYDRAPAMLKQTLLRPPPPPHQLAAATQSPAEPEPGKKWGIDLQKVDALNMGPLSQAMLLLGAATINCGLSVIRMIIDFLKRLLARFGFGMTPVQQVANVQAAPAQMAFEPYVLEAETREVVGQAQVDEAAAQVYRMAEAVRSKDTFLLPRGEGREELAAAIQSDAGAVPAPTAESSAPAPVVAKEVDEIGAMFSTDRADTAIPAAVSPEAAQAAPVKSAWVTFSEAAKAYSVAAAAVQNARLKDIMYFDGRPLARERRDAAVEELQKIEKVHADWKIENRLKSALGADPLDLKARSASAQARVVNAKASLLKAEKEHADFEVLFEKTPTPKVPFAVQDRHAAAAETLNKAQQILITKARLNLNIMDGNLALRQKREAFGAQLRRAETRLAAFQADPRTQPKAVADFEDVLRALAAEVNVERARLAPRPDDEDGQNVDEAGQHGQAVPGQR